MFLLYNLVFPHFVFLFDGKGQKDVYLPVKILDCFKFSKEQYFQEC